VKIREVNENGELGDYQKIDPNSKTKDEIIEELQAQLAETRSQNSEIILTLVMNDLM
jgi:hypothetical protein